MEASSGDERDSRGSTTSEGSQSDAGSSKVDKVEGGDEEGGTTKQLKKDKMNGRVS